MAEPGNFKGNRERAAVRRIRALELRQAGASYRQIGRQLQVSEAQAFRDVERALAALAKFQDTEAEKVRTLELARLDAMLIPMLRQAEKGSQGAVDRVLRIMERRAKMLGIDGPGAAGALPGAGEMLVREIVIRTLPKPEPPGAEAADDA